MRHVYPSDIKNDLEFAEKAARHFERNPHHRTYGEALTQLGGGPLAVRWGGGGDCVLVAQLDQIEPVLYAEAIDPAAGAAAELLLSRPALYRLVEAAYAAMTLLALTPRPPFGAPPIVAELRAALKPYKEAAARLAPDDLREVWAVRRAVNPDPGE